MRSQFDKQPPTLHPSCNVLSTLSSTFAPATRWIQIRCFMSVRDRRCAHHFPSWGLESLWSFVPQWQAEAYLVLFSGENARLDLVHFLPSQSLRMVVHLPRNRSKPRHGSATSELEFDGPCHVLPLCDFQLCVMLVLRLSMLLLPGHSGQCPWQQKEESEPSQCPRPMVRNARAQESSNNSVGRCGWWRRCARVPW